MMKFNVVKRKQSLIKMVIFVITMLVLFGESSTTLAVESSTDLSKIKITLPAGFDFKSAIKSSYKSPEEYFKHFKLDSPEDSNAYGLALAKLTLGLVKEDSMAISGAKYLFKVSNKTSENKKEKELSSLGSRYVLPQLKRHLHKRNPVRHQMLLLHMPAWLHILM